MKTLNIKIKAGQQRILPIVWLGGRDEKIRVRSVMDQPGANLKIIVVILAKSGHLDLQTDIIHQAPRTLSRTIVRGVLDQTAAVDIQGRIRIEKGAKNADGNFLANLLLLSARARAKALPQLEVLENEVRAGHGATIGKIDRAQMFYLMSRGLNEPQVKSIIIKGFFEELIAEMPKEQAKQIVNHNFFR